MKRLLLIVLMSFAALGTSFAQSATVNRLDALRPDAPELAALGEFTTGVMTMELVNPDQVDVLAEIDGDAGATYDRPLTIEVWYPADTGGAEPSVYSIPSRDPAIMALVQGQAVRDAAPDASSGPYPLIVVSHGYPGNRFFISHYAENLATKGYVVASIAHTESTFLDQLAFGSTLLNRSLDQIFVIDSMEAMSADDESDFAGMVDTENTGIIGYSMGGYGALNVIGGGYTEASVGYNFSPPNGLLSARQSGNYEADPRVKAVLAIGPWGMNAGFWDAETLQGIETPVLFYAGGLDDVSGYENGVRAIWEQATATDRWLLTFDNALHNAAAPMPIPQELLLANSPFFDSYADPVWDTLKMNNIGQHFATAFFGAYLQGETDLLDYFDVVESANDGVYSVDDEGNFTDEHSYWTGFQARTATGLTLEFMGPDES